MDEGLVNCWRRFIVRGSAKRKIKMAGLSCSGWILILSGRLRLCFWGYARMYDVADCFVSRERFH